MSLMRKILLTAIAWFAVVILSIAAELSTMLTLSIIGLLINLVCIPVIFAVSVWEKARPSKHAGVITGASVRLSNDRKTGDTKELEPRKSSENIYYAGLFPGRIFLDGRAYHPSDDD